MPVDMSDIPAWMSAIATVAGVFVSILALILSWKAINKVSKVSLDFAVVSSEEVVLRHTGFGSYGLSVQLKDEILENCGEVQSPVYLLSFSIVPDYFEVTTMEGATAFLKHESPKEYKLFFIGSGFGSPIVKASFKVQAY